MFTLHLYDTLYKMLLDSDHINDNIFSILKCKRNFVIEIDDL